MESQCFHGKVFAGNSRLLRLRAVEEATELDKLLTVREVARRLRLSQSAVYNLIWRGQIPYVNLACGQRRLPRIRNSDLDVFIRQRTRQEPFHDET